jgi:hypothetical protein
MSAANHVRIDLVPDLTKNRLEMRLQSRTGGRLRFLAVEFIAGRISIRAVAPSYHVRQLAEQTALELHSADRLDLEIQVRSYANLREDCVKTANSGDFGLKEMRSDAF